MVLRASYFKCIIFLTISSCHGFQNTWNPSYKYNNHQQKIPQEIMVDAVNSLALKLLAIHNENNANNIAISPYGALTVLVALQEGTHGEASQEIQWAINTPTDLSIVRIGLRDIHRHLKSYFIPEEGFLSGLTFSNSNVTLRSEYQEVLNFYGFDISSFNTALYPDIPTSTKPPIEIDFTTTTLTPSTTREELLTTIETNESTTSTESIITTQSSDLTTQISTTESGQETTTETSTVQSSTTETTSTTLETSTELTTSDTSSDTPTTTLESSTLEPSNLEKNEISRKPRSVLDYLIARYYDDHSAVTPRPELVPPPNQIPIVGHDTSDQTESKFLIHDKYPQQNVSFMTYDTILPFHYSEHLHTLALRFPLDSNKYYLLLLLPEYGQDIDQLICNLRLNVELKFIIENLKYTHVRAQIPSFMLKGYVVLTPTLERMGIHKVFEPRQADFSPMTDNKDIYVTNVEQAITVTIRNYMESEKNEEFKNMYEDEPVFFNANRPFLYFVIDSEIGVTLMAGKYLFPWPSKIDVCCHVTGLCKCRILKGIVNL